LAHSWSRLITGASDDDPSGIATYSQAGAGFGFATLWTAIITFPLMAAVQEMCAVANLLVPNIPSFAFSISVVAQNMILAYLHNHCQHYNFCEGKMFLWKLRYNSFRKFIWGYS
jgi:hypothetical protein